MEQLDLTFAALADPTRRAMVHHLTLGPASVHRLAEPFTLSQQMISKHIAFLVRAHIVLKTKRGRESICTLQPQTLKIVSDWASNYRLFWEESFEKLNAVVEQIKADQIKEGKHHGQAKRDGPDRTDDRHKNF